MPPHTFFVTGTDTEVGKTLVAAALLELAKAHDLRCVGLKPIAAGCERVGGQLVNDDARALMAASGATLDYSTVNPVALEPAIAPHIAAGQAGLALNADDLAERCRAALQGEFDFAIVEGAGGWLVPINGTETLADVCIGVGAPAILVVGMKLGCLNHALLTARAIADAGGKLAGWVANSATLEMPMFDANVATLRERLDAPCLGVVPYLGAGAEPAAAMPHLAIEPLLT